MFGWCQQGFHAHYEGEWSKPCPGKYFKIIVHETKKGGRKKKVKDSIVSDEQILCDCPCHGGK